MNGYPERDDYSSDEEHDAAVIGYKNRIAGSFLARITGHPVLVDTYGTDS